MNLITPRMRVPARVSPLRAFRRMAFPDGQVRSPAGTSVTPSPPHPTG
jgi:hypothetical protein